MTAVGRFETSPDNLEVEKRFAEDHVFRLVERRLQLIEQMGRGDPGLR